MWWYQCVCSTLTRGFVEHVRPKRARAGARSRSLRLSTSLDSLARARVSRGSIAGPVGTVMWIHPVLWSQSHSIYSSYTCLIY